MRVMLTGYRPSDMSLSNHPFGAVRGDLQSHVFEEFRSHSSSPPTSSATSRWNFPTAGSCAASHR